MGDSWKVSGKKVPLPDCSQIEWEFSLRPGGWIIGKAPSGLRKRFVLQESQGRLSASLRGRLWFGECSRESSSRGGPNPGVDSDLTAQFPGKVRKILVQEDSQIQEGEPLLWIEAMKMEFAIRAPFAGRVIRVLVQEGQQLVPGDRFLDMEVEP